MDEVTPAVIAIAFGLSAVFIPVAFISGITGQLLPAVRPDHRVFDAAVGVQFAHAQPRAGGPAAQAARGQAGLVGAAFLTSCLAGSSGCSTGVSRPPTAATCGPCAASCASRAWCCWFTSGWVISLTTCFKICADRFHSDAGPGLSDRQCADARCRVDRAHQRGGIANGRRPRCKTPGGRWDLRGGGLFGSVALQLLRRRVLFLRLLPFSERAGKPGMSAAALVAQINRKYARIQGGFGLVLLPPPVEDWAMPAASRCRSRIAPAPATPQQLQAVTEQLIAAARKRPEIGRAVHHLPRQCSPALRQRRSGQGQGRERRRSPISSRRCRSIWAATTSTTSTISAAPGT